MLLVAFWFFGNAAPVFAHGGEDHGDAKPKTTASDKGTISRTARLGEYELTLKHPALEPDTATAARLFITKFQTNEAIDKATAQIEIESANGAASATTAVAVEKTDIAGTYSVKIPALPEGVYAVRAKLTFNGETDTATFSGVEVKTQTAEAADSTANGMSWARTALIVFVFALVLGLFGGLIYFVWRYAETGGETYKEETVSV